MNKEDIVETAKMRVVSKESDAGESRQPACDAAVLDQMHEARMKLRFMTVAIAELWDSDSDYPGDVVFGSKLLLHDIEDDLAAVHKALDSEAPE